MTASIELIVIAMESTHPAARKPGRPLSFDRQKALRQAMLEFWKHGYETTSIADLTAAMGVTAPSLYAAFGDKKQLFLEATRLYAGSPDDLQHQLDQAMTARDAAQAMLRSAAIAFTGETTPRGCLLASATASGSVGSSEVQRAVADIRQDIVTRLEKRIGRDMVAGILPASTPAAALAAMVVAVIQGMSVLARDGFNHDALLGIAEGALWAWPTPSKEK
jgi:AcrR family transcriptional regulator